MQYLSFLISLVFLFGCSDKKEIAFYHWKSRCEVKKDFAYPLYVKVLDIGVKRVIKTSCKRAFTPVVYIDNQALKKREFDELVKLIKSVKSKNLQVDCDWSQSTRAKYFLLLKELKKSYNLSVTIRLHQLKYPKQTGIPPVKSGVLMFYNMSDFLDTKTKNYILDLKVAKSYLKGFKIYPLKLNLALPLYSMVTVMRYSKVVKLIDDVKSKELDENFKHIKENLYKVTKTHYFEGSLLYEGDLVRIDEVSLKQLKQAIMMIPFEFERVIFFRYSSLKEWDIKKLKEL